MQRVHSRPAAVPATEPCLPAPPPRHNPNDWYEPTPGRRRWHPPGPPRSNGDGGTKQKGPNTDTCTRGVEGDWMHCCQRSSLLHSTQSWVRLRPIHPPAKKAMIYAHVDSRWIDVRTQRLGCCTADWQRLTWRRVWEQNSHGDWPAGVMATRQSERPHSAEPPGSSIWSGQRKLLSARAINYKYNQVVCRLVWFVSWNQPHSSNHL